MQRSPRLTVTILCPHFERPVGATRNAASERLVDCTAKGECVTERAGDAGVTIQVYPAGCPVFRPAGGS